MPCFSSLLLLLLLLCLYNLSYSEALNGGFSVEIIHRDSPQSPFYSSSETKFQRVSNALLRSINRGNHLSKSMAFPNTVRTTVIPDFGEYLMRYAVGTPLVKVYGILDTGSDIIWMQCKPCKKCYRQATPLFNPSKSTTYKTIPCNSPTCHSVFGTSCSSSTITKHCKYDISYLDGTFSHGDLSVETLTLGSTNGSPIPLPRTAIGCGHNNSMNFKGANSGIVGLGRGPVSLINQLGFFNSKLSFGDAAMVEGHGTVSTPLVSIPKHVFYYLTLEGFSVGSNRKEFGSSFSRFGGEGNIIIDSGTTLTVLPEDVYTWLESAVAHEVKVKPVEDPNHVLGLCYRGTLDELDLPVITAHFRGASVLLHRMNTFVEVADKVVCLAFQGTRSGAIFGNLAQQNLWVGYDLRKNTVSFKQTDCTKM
ncbi:aspartyl protease family protein [Vigna unguiculata]|uniref:Aspartyl protease family protein n=1 Tax=Vigna unguiculata TaxID=3917 RepID=A0A4D6LAJ3_VIGUN|nr:aspartyl protease family protein [Vigna unguiculata]QCD85559.1 aspartyl protease family protein [Vigna unguiculata]